MFVGKECISMDKSTNESMGCCCCIGLCKSIQIFPNRKFKCDLCNQAFNKKTVLVRHMKRFYPSREMKGTDKVPVKQLGWCWRELSWRYLWTPVWRSGSRSGKETSPVLHVHVPGIKKKTDLSTVTKYLQTSDKVAGSSDSISIVQESPLCNQLCACCQKIIQKIDKIHKSTHAVVNIKSRQKRAMRRLSGTLNKIIRKSRW